jgi:tripartite-type tricarboxylate transporter receptor subunit TctC
MLLVSNHVPQKIIEQVRQAFDAMAADQNFQSDERALGLPVEVVSGVKLDEEIERLYATPSAVLEKAKMLLRE